MNRLVEIKNSSTSYVDLLEKGETVCGWGEENHAIERLEQSEHILQVDRDELAFCHLHPSSSTPFCCFRPVSAKTTL